MSDAQPIPLHPPLPRMVQPDPPRYDLWPEAMRSAWRLSGALVPCGPGLRGLGWPETPRVRLTAIASWLRGGRIATHLTAAWVWGAARRPGDPLQVSLRPGHRRPTAADPGLRIYESRGAWAECRDFGGLAVTTPVRTALDLLHDPAGFGLRETVACRLLLRAVEGGGAAVSRRIEQHRRPYGRLARARLAALQYRDVGLPLSRGQPPLMR
ncbi:MAG: hypothetical protein D3X82_15970 [Candidatus Leucobacter sulfamidivorax]|nr:hypothetical protein [Candidatus Leucobacter sulfamidivorax]